MLRLEARAAPSRAFVIASPLIALATTVVIGVALFLALGKDPGTGLAVFFWEPIKNGYAWSEMAVKATPLILIALGLAFCFRANVWNIGAEGQYILGAIFAGGVAMQADVQSSRAIVVAILAAGMLGGLLWAAITALLRDRFNANEILVSLMLVYVAEMLLSYLVYGPWKDPQGYNFPQTVTFAKPTQVPRLVDGWRAHIGIVIAMGAVAAMSVFLFRLFRGFQALVGGQAAAAARYAGFSSRAALWTALLTSGALAGLAGALEATGPLGQLTPYVPVGYGFAAIIVGIVLSAVLMSMFYIGGELAQSRMQLPKSITGVFQGLLLFSLLAADTLIHFRVRWVRANAGKVAA
jgi:simple sugar transport system permease protein